MGIVTDGQTETDHKQAAHVDAGTDPIHDVTVLRVCHLALHLGRGKAFGAASSPHLPSLPVLVHNESHGSPRCSQVLLGWC